MFDVRGKYTGYGRSMVVNLSGSLWPDLREGLNESALSVPVLSSVVISCAQWVYSILLFQGLFMTIPLP